MENETLSASLEDYLETISHVVSEKGAARAKDISRRLKVNSSSVTGALRVLSEKGMINYAPYDVITLTRRGKQVAEDVIRRHEVLRDFFVRVLGVEEEEAEEGACRMEHAVPGKILERLVDYVDFVDSCPRAGSEWVKEFRKYCEKKGSVGQCDQCLSRCIEDIRSHRERLGSSEVAVPLLSMKPGQRGRVLGLSESASRNRRLQELEMEPGNLVEVEELSSEADGVEVKVKGYHLSLRRDEAAGISVEVLG